MWYPQDKEELDRVLDEYLKNGKSKEKVNGLVVPHAGYEYSGKVAGKAFSLVRGKKIDKAIVIGLSHYIYLEIAVTSHEKYWETPLGKVKLFNENFPRANIDEEHSIQNQIPFLQKLKVKEVMPLMIGQITIKQAKEIAEKISKIDAFYVFSTDLSHFLPYEQAVRKDKQSIQIIENLDIANFNKIDACGMFPLLVLMYLCEEKGWKPKLVEYKNSGDVIGDKSRVVGYGSFWF